MRQTMWNTLCWTLLMVCATIAAPSALCPESCTCTFQEGTLSASCSSFVFLRKPLFPKQISEILSLSITNKSLTKIDPKLKNLRNLNILDLSHNNISDLSLLRYLPKLKHLTMKFNHIRTSDAFELPKSLEILDLSSNYLTDVPHEWIAMAALQELNLSENPIVCTCSSASTRDSLLKLGVKIVEPLVCRSPGDVRGVAWVSFSCSSVDSLFGEMQGDAPDAGSGSGDLEGEIEDVDQKGNYLNETFYDDIEREYIRASFSNESIDTTIEPEPEEFNTPSREDEGSGDGVIEFDLGQLSSTTHASESSAIPDFENEDYDDYDTNAKTEETSSPEPVEETVSVAFEFPLERSFPKACHINCSTPAPIETEKSDTSPAPSFGEGIKIIMGDLGLITEPTEHPVKSDVEIVNNKAADHGEIGKVVEHQQAKATNNTFIFLAVLLSIMVALIVYAYVRKRANRRKNYHRRNIPRAPEKIPPIEMKVIPKSEITTDKSNGNQEMTPLMNGQNGKPVEETLQDAKQPDETQENDVELRQNKEKTSLLTPEATRVTIKASELPDSVPRTPLLVTRHLSSDGRNIITTPTLEHSQ